MDQGRVTYDPFLDTVYYKGKPVKAFADFQNENITGIIEKCRED